MCVWGNSLCVYKCVGAGGCVAVSVRVCVFGELFMCV